jgi:hypothetical protein
MDNAGNAGKSRRFQEFVGHRVFVHRFRPCCWPT